MLGKKASIVSSVLCCTMNDITGVDTDYDIAPQTQIIRVEEEKEKVEAEMMRQARDLEMLQNTIQKSQRERENMQSEMEILLDRINKMSDMLDKSRVGNTNLVLW